MKKSRLGLALLTLALSGSVATAAPVAVTGGTIHPISGPAIENGVLVFDGKRIIAVGTVADVTIPAAAGRVDATGLHVWPGLIDAFNRMALREVGALRATNDHDEHGTMNPESRAEIAVNASSMHIAVTRANGILLTATFPQGGLVPGSGAVLALNGWTSEEMVRRAPVGLLIEWPGMNRPEEPVSSGEPEAWEEQVSALDAMVEEARAYVRARDAGSSPRDADVRWESLRGVVAGKTPVWIQATTLRQIRAAMDWTDEQRLKMVLVDGTSSRSGDSYRVAEELADRDIPVVLRTRRRPSRDWDPYDLAYTIPGILHEAGVTVLFGTWSYSAIRSLPQDAARAAAYGLPRAAAERALTLDAARVMGLDADYGSLDPGKTATFLLVEGDVLDIRMNVKRAWIDGEEISLESRHTRLWKKWSSRPMPSGFTQR